jgi:hypothetical protein
MGQEKGKRAQVIISWIMQSFMVWRMRHLEPSPLAVTV